MRRRTDSSRTSCRLPPAHPGAVAGCADPIVGPPGLGRPGRAICALLCLLSPACAPVADTAGSAADSGQPALDERFATEVISFEPGENAGYGEEDLPEVVLGPPDGGGEIGSLDVLSLGREGEIVLALGAELVDGEGADLLVFENPFPGWYETGRVAVSQDGSSWQEWPCDPLDEAAGFPGCAGVGLVWAASDNDLDPTDPEEAGGDAFDLADLGLESARFVRIRDSGENSYDGNNGGFDLDAIARVNPRSDP